jgi:hypothetical protein
MLYDYCLLHDFADYAGENVHSFCNLYATSIPGYRLGNVRRQSLYLRWDKMILITTFPFISCWLSLSTPTIGNCLYPAAEMKGKKSFVKIPFNSSSL